MSDIVYMLGLLNLSRTLSCIPWITFVTMIPMAFAVASPDQIGSEIDARYGNFNPNRVIGLSAAACRMHGGQMPPVEQGNDCDLGRVLAVYRCDNDVMVSVIQRPEDQAILHWTGSSVERANLLTSGGGARWASEQLVVWERGPEARVVATAWESRCDKL